LFNLFDKLLHNKFDRERDFFPKVPFPKKNHPAKYTTAATITAMEIIPQKIGGR